MCIRDSPDGSVDAEAKDGVLRGLYASAIQAVAEGGGAADEVWATYTRMRKAGVRLRGDPYPYTLVCRALGDYKQARDLSSRARAALGRAIYQS